MRSRSGHCPLIYAGRFADRIESADLSDGYEVFGEKVKPSRLAAAVEEATLLIMLDPRSFPFEVMSEDHWNVPLIVALPSDLDAGALLTAFGGSLFEHLGFFDRIVIPNSDVWRDLRERYRWAESQRIESDAADLKALIHDLRAELEDSPENWRSSKAVYRARARALGQPLAAARADHPGDIHLEILGIGDPMWAMMLDLSKFQFRGVGVHEDMVEHSRREFPELSFKKLGMDLRVLYEDRSFDLVFGVDVFQDEPPPVREALLSEMWRVARPGGRLLFVEDFVFERAEKKDPMPVSRFMELILEATAYQVVLDHFEAIRYPGDDLFRGGVISLLRLGT